MGLRPDVGMARPVRRLTNQRDVVINEQLRWKIEILKKKEGKLIMSLSFLPPYLNLDLTQATASL
jgi:hypothetical protein